MLFLCCHIPLEFATKSSWHTYLRKSFEEIVIDHVADCALLQHLRQFMSLSNYLKGINLGTGSKMVKNQCVYYKEERPKYHTSASVIKDFVLALKEQREKPLSVYKMIFCKRAWNS